MEKTRAQLEAITITDRPLVVEAGAGTGKTWVLVQRFLHLLDVNPHWPLESIIAVTFTEKAAREMRSRIRVEIEKRAAKADPGSHWHQRRRSLATLQVSTIHGLCARLLRENAVAAGLDPHFVVLDEQESALLREEAVHRALNELSTSRDPALSLLDSLRVGDVRDELVSLTGRRGTILRLFETLEAPEELLQRWREGLESMRNLVWHSLAAREPGLDQALDGLASVMIGRDDDRLAEAVRLAQSGIFSLSTGNIAEAAESFSRINRLGGKQGNWGGSEALAEIKEWLRAAQSVGKEFCRKRYHEPLGPEDERAAQALQQWKTLWARVDGVYNALKWERQALDFDDLELLAERLLAAVPRTERLSEYVEDIHHLMVDEFQDTNAAQKRIVYALAPPAPDGRLFVVGDAKQSVYRFRQAEVSIFNQVSADIANATGRSPVRLDRSFRTHHSLVEAHNQLFERVFAPLGREHMTYEARSGALTAHRESHPSSAAPIEILLLPAEDEKGGKVDAYRGRMWEARRLAERLHQLYEEKFPVWDRDAEGYRPFRYSDAVVLFRATTEMPVYEAQFKAARIPYLTVSGRGYYGRSEVRDLIALLAALYNPGDDLNVATVLRSPLFSLSDETLYRLRWLDAAGDWADSPIPYMTALQSPGATAEPEAVRAAAVALGRLAALAGQVDVWHLLRETLDLTGFEATLALSDSRSGGRQRNNIQKFLELAREWGGASLSSFLRRVQELSAREAREGEALASGEGAVQLMSIHAAKGLEWPVVAVADLGRSSRGGQSRGWLLFDPAYGLVCRDRNHLGEWSKPASYRWAEWQDEQMEQAESKRLLYVACTRAADLLLLSGRAVTARCWMTDVLESWELSAEGPEEELCPRDGFTLRIIRPSVAPDLHDAQPTPSVTEGPPLDTVPPLVAPYLPRTLIAHSPAIELLRQMDEAAGELPELRPLSRLSINSSAAIRVSAERLLRRALVDWRCLHLGNGTLYDWLWTTAGRERFSAPEEREQAVRTAQVMLNALRNHGQFKQILKTERARTNVPYTLETPVGSVHGTMDLLCETPSGEWKLMHWESMVPLTSQGARIAEVTPLLAVQARAAERVLGQMPSLSICFLGYNPAFHDIEPETLRKSWDMLFERVSP